MKDPLTQHEMRIKNHSKRANKPQKKDKNIQINAVRGPKGRGQTISRHTAQSLSDLGLNDHQNETIP